ncbi:hypothetical protein DFH09DRAFT_1311566 [Mycena vulgaris]|nr:hypothetical protein DFH09DRAFT_1311566 [Mycena vulgaris]
MTVAFFVLLIFDHLLTLDQEVELVWKNHKPSLARYIYIWNRYCSLLLVGVCTSGEHFGALPKGAESNTR